MSMKTILGAAGFGVILILIMIWADSNGDQNTMLLCGMILGLTVAPILLISFNNASRSAKRRRQQSSVGDIVKYEFISVAVRVLLNTFIKRR